MFLTRRNHLPAWKYCFMKVMLQETNRRTIIITCIGWDGNKKKWYIILWSRRQPTYVCGMFSLGLLGIFIRLRREAKANERNVMNQLSDTLKVIDGSSGRTIFGGNLDGFEPEVRWSFVFDIKTVSAFWIIKSGSLIKVERHQPSGAIIKIHKIKIVEQAEV